MLATKGGPGFAKRFFSSSCYLRVRNYSNAAKKHGWKKKKDFTSRIMEKENVKPTVELYCNPYHFFDKFLYGLLFAQVTITTSAVIYLVTPIHDVVPIPQSVIDRFIPPVDPDDEIAQDSVVQDTYQRWITCLAIAWVCSCAAFYFKRRHFSRNATGARLLKSATSDGYKLEIDYFFKKKKQFIPSQLLRETQISPKEWGVVVAPIKPSTFFVFQEEHLTGASKAMILNLMHNREVSQQTVSEFNPKANNLSSHVGYVFGKADKE